MGKTFRYYTMLRPLRDSYIDDDSATLTRISVVDSGRDVEIALIGGTSDPRMIRVSVSNVTEEPPYEERKRFDDLAETMLALLRIFHDNELAFAEPRFRYGNLIEDDLLPDLNIRLGKPAPTFNIDAGTMFAYMNSDKELQDIFRLFADSVYPYLPVQYRYLSAFKIIEHEFKRSRKKWNLELDTLLDHFKAEYDTLGLGRMKMKAFMINLRDKCAHIKLGNASELTIVGIGSQDTELVTKFLPLLIKVIQKHLFDRYKSDGTVFRSVRSDAS
jgi:hypothetical protein